MSDDAMILLAIVLLSLAFCGEPDRIDATVAHLMPECPDIATKNTEE